MAWSCRFRLNSPTFSDIPVLYAQDMGVPNYLKMYRKRSGLSQRELASLLGCAHGSKVSRYERGERVPSLRALFAYEVVFSVRVRDLFPGTYGEVRDEVRKRARRLMRELDRQKFTPVVKQKVDSLVDVVSPAPSTPNGKS
jgi:transcriptional regulator with XRE-family HTH domain